MPKTDPRRNKQGRIPLVKQKRYQLYRRRVKIKVRQCGKESDMIVRTIHPQQINSRYWLPGSTDKNGNRPLLTQYNRKLYCVYSEMGDLSNPKERTASFLDHLYIELPDPNKCCGCGGNFEPDELIGGQYLLCPECIIRR